MGVKESAMVLVMPVDFVDKPKMVFVRLKAATKLHELNEPDSLFYRFVVLIIGPTGHESHMYDVGRAVSICLTEEASRNSFYVAINHAEIVETVEIFKHSSMLVSSVEFHNPEARIEPSLNLLSKVGFVRLKIVFAVAYFVVADSFIDTVLI